MKTTIWKFPFPLEDGFELEMPRYARILHVGMQGSRMHNGKACIWALVSVDAPKVKRKFALKSSGESCDDLNLYRPPGECSEFVGSFFVYPDGSLIYHLFDRGEAAEGGKGKNDG